MAYAALQGQLFLLTLHMLRSPRSHVHTLVCNKDLKRRSESRVSEKGPLLTCMDPRLPFGSHYPSPVPIYGQPLDAHHKYHTHGRHQSLGPFQIPPSPQHFP